MTELNGEDLFFKIENEEINKITPADDGVKYAQICDSGDEEIITFDYDSNENEKETVSFDGSILTVIIAFFTFLGERAYENVAQIAKKLFSWIVVPAYDTGKNLKSTIQSVLSKAVRLPASTFADFRKIRDESDFVKQSARKIKSKRRFAVPKAMLRYYRHSFKRYGRFWKSVFNVLFPIAAVLVLVSVVNERQNTTYALEVNYNGNVLGYVENEQIFNEARNSAVEMLSYGGESGEDKFNSAVYSIRRVTLNKLSDASVITDKLIKNSDAGYVQACGIYIDGEFLCAVKNESDAVTVFDNILAPYEAKASGGDKVAFVEEITYQQGLYADNAAVIWDATRLEETLDSEKASAVYYTVKAGDTFSGIAESCHITEKTLANLNPKVSTDNIYIGDELLVSQQVRYVRVKVMKTEKRYEAIPYATVKKDSSTLYEGTTKTVQDGIDGKNQITELVTYIDGIRTYVSHISTKQVSAPQDEIIYVGTKEQEPVYTPPETYYYEEEEEEEEEEYEESSNYSSSSGLSWPTVSAYYISSYYGYRTLNGYYKFHGGVDIIRSGGDSAGLSVIAAGSGTVVECGWNGSYGNTIVIDHGGGIRTRYAHMQNGSLAVSYGSYVSKGQHIGCIGSTGNSTGPHLHFEVIVNGERMNPLNYVG
ncbi:MAG: M23 family metallopeptidase [Clostridia bacterium]|nr:M23 family metallopeptidase [Clostridia bacterium]